MPHYLNVGVSGLDWQDWLRGIMAGFIGGGAGAVSAGFGAMLADPEKINVQHPGMLFKTVIFTFMVSGVINMMAYLHQNPVPAVKTVTTTETTTVPGPPLVVKTVEVKETTPVEEVHGTGDGGKPQ